MKNFLYLILSCMFSLAIIVTNISLVLAEESNDNVIEGSTISSTPLEEDKSG